MWSVWSSALRRRHSATRVDFRAIAFFVPWQRRLTDVRRRAARTGDLLPWDTARENGPRRCTCRSILDLARTMGRNGVSGRGPDGRPHRRDRGPRRSNGRDRGFDSRPPVTGLPVPGDRTAETEVSTAAPGDRTARARGSDADPPGARGSGAAGGGARVAPVAPLDPLGARCVLVEDRDGLVSPAARRAWGSDRVPCLTRDAGAAETARITRWRPSASHRRRRNRCACVATGSRFPPWALSRLGVRLTLGTS